MIGALLAPGIAGADDGTFLLFLDLDRDTGTGCQATTAEGPIAGVDLRLTTTVDLLAAEVVASTWASCATPGGVAFGAETPVAGLPAPPWGAVGGEGTSGSTLIETYLPLAAAPGATVVRGYASFTSGAGSDAVLTPGGGVAVSGIPIEMRPPPPLPGLSLWGFGLLATTIVGTATLLRSRGAALAAALAVLAIPVAVRAGLGDGSLRPWDEQDRVAVDLPGDAPEGADVVGLFASRDALQGVLLVRVDVFLGPPICLEWETVDPGVGFPCNPQPPPDGGPFGNAVALTFDDGPNPATTPSILATLRAENVPATFFQQGSRLETAAEQALALEIHEDPLFRVVNHSYSHPDFTTLTAEQARDEVVTTSELLREAIGDACYFPRFFRFPFGVADCESVAVVHEQGLSVAGVHMDAVDWCYAAGGGTCPAGLVPWMPAEFRDDLPGWVVEQLPLNGGGILLMHDIHANTAAELPDVIAALRAAGATFVDLENAALFPILNAGLNPPEPPACCDGSVH